MADDPTFVQQATCVAEGICPRHLVPLERRENYGWCESCQSGWQVRTATDGERWMGEMVVTEFFVFATSTIGFERQAVDIGGPA